MKYELLYQSVLRRTRVRKVLHALAALAALSLIGSLAPQYAAADATPASPPAAGTTGLPDGRVYEEASSPNKNGNEVMPERPAFVAAGGNGVMYGVSGSFGNATNSILQATEVSERTSHGWVSRTAHGLPAPGRLSNEEYLGVNTLETLLVPSADLSHLLFGTWGHTPYAGSPDAFGFNSNIYLAGPDPSAQPEWIARSLIEGQPAGANLQTAEGNPEFAELDVAGGSPDLKTIYFYYEGELFPGASRLYEYRDGVLSDAGVLPAGETSSGEAAPAAQPAEAGSERSGLVGAAGFDNEVSADGSRIFFTRQDEAGTRELYVRITAPDGTLSTKLVSQSQMPGQVGEPAAHGPVAMPSVAGRPASPYSIETAEGTGPPSYVYASPDGTHAFFQSADQLTSDAPEGEAVKAYEFDVDTGKLEYLPGLVGSIVAVSDDGSSLFFENTANAPASIELERWSAGSGGGTLTPIAALPECKEACLLEPAYVSADGKVLTFATVSPIPGFNDGGIHYERGERFEGEEPRTWELPVPNFEVFRYEVEAGRLGCLSCPPEGTTPSSDAMLAPVDFIANSRGGTGSPVVVGPGRAVSPDGKRVFFQSREALVPQDTNGREDVYEWENGTVYLLSSGQSPESSFFAGISESGNDVFFTTTEGIALGDNDGAYDVYDARIPRPGDSPPEAIPCSGSVCQGQPSTPQLLGPPASEEFNGLGNLTPTTSATVRPKSLTRAQKLARALKQCRRKTGKRRRKRCARKARRRYKVNVSHAHRADIRHHNGRGN